MEKSLEPGPYPIGRSAPRRRRFGNWVVVAALLLVVAIIGAVGLAPRLWSATFGFLHQKTGWDISFSFLPYSAGDPYWWVFLVGLANTVGTGAIAICSATLVGFAVGVARLSRTHLRRRHSQYSADPAGRVLVRRRAASATDACRLQLPGRDFPVQSRAVPAEVRRNDARHRLLGTRLDGGVVALTLHAQRPG
jgi:hypothetical protein